MRRGAWGEGVDKRGGGMGKGLHTMRGWGSKNLGEGVWGDMSKDGN